MALFEDLAVRYIRDLIADFQLQDYQAAGIVGNGGHESGGFTQLQELHPTSGRGGLGHFLSLLAVGLILYCTAAQAQGRDDRYFVARQGTSASDVTRAVAAKRAGVRQTHHARTHVARRPGKRTRSRLRRPAPGAVSPLAHVARGFVRELRRAARGPMLAGVNPPLAAKAREIASRCGSRVISAVRHTYVAGTHKLSLHASGRAVDMAGNPGCIYAHLRRWPGGYSIDYSAVRHVHISLGGREDGARFAHYRGHARHRYARHHRGRYARGARGAA